MLHYETSIKTKTFITISRHKEPIKINFILIIQFKMGNKFKDRDIKTCTN